MGLEPTTFCSLDECSTIELYRDIGIPRQLRAQGPNHKIIIQRNEASLNIYSVLSIEVRAEGTDSL